MDEQHEDHLDRQTVMQQVVNEVAASSEGASVATTMDRLLTGMVTRGLEPPPASWLEAVAHDAVAGRVYVVSEEAVAQAGLEPAAQEAMDAVQSGEVNGDAEDDEPRKGDVPD